VTRLRIAPIVEGHGEVISARSLLERVWREVAGGESIEVLRPVRRPRTKLLKRDPTTHEILPDRDEILRAIKLASMKLANTDEPDTPRLVLLMFDADEDCPKEIVKALADILNEVDPRIDLATIVPCVEYETWFVAAADSLRDFLELRPGDEEISNPETARLGKKWIQDRFLHHRYSETLDQVRLTNRMDLQLCRERSPSFDKLCRELENRLKAYKKL